jgi:hypothetical protein
VELCGSIMVACEILWAAWWADVCCPRRLSNYCLIIRKAFHAFLVRCTPLLPLFRPPFDSSRLSELVSLFVFTFTPILYICVKLDGIRGILLGGSLVALTKSEWT